MTNQAKNRVTTKGTETTDWGELTLALGKGLGIAFIALVVLLFFGAMAVSQGTVSQENMKGLVLATAFLSALIGGIYVISHSQKTGVFWGILVGGLLFLSLFLLGICLYPGTSIENSGIELLFACLCGGAVSTLLAKKKKKILKNAKKS